MSEIKIQSENENDAKTNLILEENFFATIKNKEKIKVKMMSTKKKREFDNEKRKKKFFKNHIEDLGEKIEEYEKVEMDFEFLGKHSVYILQIIKGEQKFLKRMVLVKMKNNQIDSKKIFKEDLNKINYLENEDSEEMKLVIEFGLENQLFMKKKIFINNSEQISEKLKNENLKKEELIQNLLKTYVKFPKNRILFERIGFYIKELESEISLKLDKDDLRKMMKDFEEFSYISSDKMQNVNFLLKSLLAQVRNADDIFWRCFKIYKKNNKNDFPFGENLKIKIDEKEDLINLKKNLMTILKDDYDEQNLEKEIWKKIYKNIKKKIVGDETAKKKFKNLFNAMFIFIDWIQKDLDFKDIKEKEWKLLGFFFELKPFDNQIDIFKSKSTSDKKFFFFWLKIFKTFKTDEKSKNLDFLEQMHKIHKNDFLKIDRFAKTIMKCDKDEKDFYLNNIDAFKDDYNIFKKQIKEKSDVLSLIKNIILNNEMMSYFFLEEMELKGKLNDLIKEKIESDLEEAISFLKNQEDENIETKNKEIEYKIKKILNKIIIDMFVNKEKLEFQKIYIILQHLNRSKDKNVEMSTRFFSKIKSEEGLVNIIKYFKKLNKILESNVMSILMKQIERMKFGETEIHSCLEDSKFLKFLFKQEENNEVFNEFKLQLLSKLVEYIHKKIDCTKQLDPKLKAKFFKRKFNEEEQDDDKLLNKNLIDQLKTCLIKQMKNYHTRKPIKKRPMPSIEIILKKNNNNLTKKNKTILPKKRPQRRRGRRGFRNSSSEDEDSNESENNSNEDEDENKNNIDSDSEKDENEKRNPFGNPEESSMNESDDDDDDDENNNNLENTTFSFGYNLIYDTIQILNNMNEIKEFFVLLKKCENNEKFKLFMLNTPIGKSFQTIIDELNNKTNQINILIVDCIINLEIFENIIFERIEFKGYETAKKKIKKYRSYYEDINSTILNTEILKSFKIFKSNTENKSLENNFSDIKQKLLKTDITEFKFEDVFEQLKNNKDDIWLMESQIFLNFFIWTLIIEKKEDLVINMKNSKVIDKMRSFDLEKLKNKYLEDLKKKDQKNDENKNENNQENDKKTNNETQQKNEIDELKKLDKLFTEDMYLKKSSISDEDSNNNEKASLTTSCLKKLTMDEFWTFFKKSLKNLKDIVKIINQSKEEKYIPIWFIHLLFFNIDRIQEYKIINDKELRNTFDMIQKIFEMINYYPKLKFFKDSFMIKNNDIESHLDIFTSSKKKSNDPNSNFVLLIKDLENIDEEIKKILNIKNSFCKLMNIFFDQKSRGTFYFYSINLIYQILLIL